jgi:hypothetical protein
MAELLVGQCDWIEKFTPRARCVNVASFNVANDDGKQQRACGFHLSRMVHGCARVERIIVSWEKQHATQA